MKTSFQFLILIFAALSMSSCSYNGMVTRDEGVAAAWAQVENVYQRRADLIPNLLSTVQGAADFERGTLEAVTNARARATGVNIDPSNLTPEALKKFQAAQDELSGALSRLLVSVERYPDLKSNESFLEFQHHLERAENRISVERKKFNDTVRQYNTYIRKFPKNFTATIFGFDKKGYFESDAGSEKAPEVNF